VLALWGALKSRDPTTRHQILYKKVFQKNYENAAAGAVVRTVGQVSRFQSRAPLPCSIKARSTYGSKEN